MPVTWQTKFLERRASASVGSLISRRKIGKILPSFLLFKRSALAKLILFKSRNSLNSESEISLGTPFTARLLLKWGHLLKNCLILKGLAHGSHMKSGAQRGLLKITSGDLCRQWQRI